MRDMKLSIFLILFIGLFSLIMAFVFFDKPIQTVTRASAAQVDISKCLLIASKLEAQATGTDTVTITVFVRNSDGGAIENKTVSVSSSLGKLSLTSGTSDAYGKVVFNLSSEVAGDAAVTALVEGQTLAQQLTVKFTQ